MTAKWHEGQLPLFDLLVQIYPQQLLVEMQFCFTESLVFSKWNLMGGGELMLWDDAQNNTVC